MSELQDTLNRFKEGLPVVAQQDFHGVSEYVKDANLLIEAARKVADLQALAREQAEDEGLWFHALTAAEAYVQQELRRLHQAIEEVTETLDD